MKQVFVEECDYYAVGPTRTGEKKGRKTSDPKALISFRGYRDLESFHLFPVKDVRPSHQSIPEKDRKLSILSHSLEKVRNLRRQGTKW